MNLTQRNIVITGGTSGIGREVVRKLHRDNQVMVVARSAHRLAQLEAACPGIHICCADLARPADVESAAAAARQKFDRLDLLINNAAIQCTPTFLDPDFEPATVAREVAVNFTAVCTLTALLLPALMRAEEAAIVNINSGLGLVPKKNSAVYCATKAAINVFSQSLRLQLEDSNVRVLQAFMPLVDTPMTSGRGTGKLSAEQAASAMLRGIEQDIEDHDIGKIRALRLLARFAPGIARGIVRAA